MPGEEALSSVEHHPTIEPAMLLVGVLMAVAILATRLSVRMGVPALVLFLGLGMLAGSDGPGGIWFDDPVLMWSLGVVALALLLFAGGLETPLHHIRPVLAPGLALATVGVAISTGATAAFYALLFHRPWGEGILLGAIVSSTDAAAVFGVLRSTGMKLKGGIQPLLEMESGSNDPMAIFLTLAATLALAGSPPSAGEILGGLGLQLALGLALGVAGGKLMVLATRRLRVSQAGLYPVFVTALAGILFGLTSLAHGSGFLAVYVAGIVLGSAPLVHRTSILRFHDALAWLAQIAMFLLLGLLVFPSHLPEVAGRGLAIAGFLLFIARPLAVVVSLTPFRVPLREQAMVAWVGLRGAVPIVLATWPRVMGVPGADLVFDVVFFVVVVSVLVQGVSLPRVARWLGVAEGAGPEAQALPVPGEGRGVRLLVLTAGEGVAGKTLVDLGLPPGVLLATIEREGEILVPQGRSVVQGGDRLTLVMTETLDEEVKRRVDSKDS